MAGITEDAPEGGVPLAWLADAPLFIDSEQVAAFYDAVVMPESETDRITISAKNIDISKNSLSGKVGAEVGTGKILEAIFPFLRAHVSGEVIGASENAAQQEGGEIYELAPIRTPQRQLIQLALHYAANLPQRTLHLENLQASGSFDDLDLTSSPRTLVYLDLPPGQPIVPIAAELPSGKVITLYKQLANETAKDVRTLPPPYPTDSDPIKTKAYWDWYADNFNALTAMNILEQEIGGGGHPRWVDYRLRAADGKSLHLSVRGRGRYDTGVFAFSTIWRGHDYGLRLVGTLKSGPGLNVLAMFEK